MIIIEKQQIKNAKTQKDLQNAISLIGKNLTEESKEALELFHKRRIEKEGLRLTHSLLGPMKTTRNGG